jgi:hypothetical protein
MLKYNRPVGKFPAGTIPLGDEIGDPDLICNIIGYKTCYFFGQRDRIKQGELGTGSWGWDHDKVDSEENKIARSG